MSATAPLASSAVPTELLGASRPLLPKLEIRIQELDDELDVLLTVPLDPSLPDEKAALDRFGGDLEIQHRSKVNLKAERQALAKTITDAYRSATVGAAMRADPLVRIDDDDLREAFMPVAVQGASLRRRLISPAEAELEQYSEADRRVAKLALTSALRREHWVVITSPSRLFPWAFLYDGEGLKKDDLTSLDFGRFWGFRHEIQEQIEGLAMRRTLPAKPRVIAAVSKDVDPLGEHGQSALAGADVDWVTSADELKSRLSTLDGDCFYFYGHAIQRDPPTPTTSELKMDGFGVTVEEVQAESGPRVSKDLVLVFLNGCGTSPLNEWSTSSFAGLLCLGGQRKVCCVATFAEVPAAFARMFAAKVWDRFLVKRERIGAALLMARREMMREWNHPMGLLYGLLGKIETRIEG